MTTTARRNQAFTLVEVVIAIAVVTIILAVLGKFLIDGMYLQRVATQRADRTAIIDALMRRLNADALGATRYDWVDGPSGPTLTLKTVGDGSVRDVRYVFERDRVIRYEAGRESGVFGADRLQFDARLDFGYRWDTLVVDLMVAPPARAHWRPARITTRRILLPHASAPSRQMSSQPARLTYSGDQP
jgi:prepilin-type N-terminal cleavage/methylation domain-containing protein